MSDEVEWNDPYYLEIQQKLEDAWNKAIGGRLTWNEVEQLYDWLDKVIKDHEDS